MQGKSGNNETQTLNIANNGMEIEELDKPNDEVEQPASAQNKKPEAQAKPKKIVKEKADDAVKTDNVEKEVSVVTRKHEKTPEERMRELQATIFVQNLDFDLTEDALFRHFRKLGPIKQAKVS